MSLFIEEHHVDEDRGYSMCEPDICESMFNTPGEAYRYYSRDGWRCKSKVRIDTPRGVKHVGWYFVKRDKYTDCDEPFLHGLWVTLFTDTPRRVVYHMYYDVDNDEGYEC